MDPFALAPADEVVVPPVGVSLDLVYCRRDARMGHEGLELLYGEIADADASDQALHHKLLHGSPRFLQRWHHLTNKHRIIHPSSTSSALPEEFIYSSSTISADAQHACRHFYIASLDGW